MLLAAVLLCIFSLIGNCPILNAARAYAQKPECGRKTAVGQAAIVVDPVSARDRAIVDAKIRVVEQCGFTIDSHNIVNMGTSFDQFVQVRAYAFIKAYEVLKEWQKDNIYYVEIEAWVKEDKEREKVRKDILSNRRILLLAEGEGSDIMTKLLRNRLANSGYAVLDSDLIQSRVSPSTWRCLETGNATCIEEEFYPYLANYIIRMETTLSPSQSGNGYKSFSTTVDIRCTQVSSGKIKPSHTSMGVVVFGRNKQHALYGQRSDGFIAKVADPACSAFMEELSKVFATNKRDIRITIRNVPNQQAFDNFKLLVRELRWVGGISSDNFYGSTGTLGVTYSERSVYLASMIAFRNIYKVDRYMFGSIEVVYRGKK